MNPAGCRARLRRLKQLSEGFKAELAVVAADRWPFYPFDLNVYLEGNRGGKESPR
jgi:hypothetical protein